jgi:hypothetical protein
MKVLCINDESEDGVGLQIKVGETYTAIDCPRNGFYTILEHPMYLGANVVYEKNRFTIIPDTNKEEQP